VLRQPVGAIATILIIIAAQVGTRVRAEGPVAQIGFAVCTRCRSLLAGDSLDVCHGGSPASRLLQLQKPRLDLGNRHRSVEPRFAGERPSWCAAEPAPAGKGRMPPRFSGSLKQAMDFDRTVPSGRNSPDHLADPLRSASGNYRGAPGLDAPRCQMPCY